MAHVEVIHEPTPPPRMGTNGRGRMDITVRFKDSNTGEIVGTNKSTKVGRNELLPNDYRKY